MIRFIAAHPNPKSGGTIKEFRKNLPGILERKMAEKLNKLAHKMPKCDQHPDNNTTVIVKMKPVEKEFVFEAAEWCCNEFHKAVKKFIEQESVR